MKYKIRKELFPFSVFTPLVINGKLLNRLSRYIKPTRRFFRDEACTASSAKIRSYDGADLTAFILTPTGSESSAPCLVYYHGGGFFFGGALHHYRVAKRYATQTPCKLIFVQYRLAPEHPYPTPVEDCYAALRWTFENADFLGIDKKRIAVGGDSAGGALAAAVCQMARDRGTDAPCFQMLIYPVTDRRMQTESQRIFTDTPMWNARLSKKMWRIYLQDASAFPYASPMEASVFSDLPPAYVETAEFDCLRDEGADYAEALHTAGVATELNEIKGVMHGFDIARNAPITKSSIAGRIEYMQNFFKLPQ